MTTPPGQNRRLSTPRVAMLQTGNAAIFTSFAFRAGPALPGIR
jgi:hypothetical protein